MPNSLLLSPFFFFNDTATTEIYTLSLHDALPISIFLRGFLPLFALRVRQFRKHSLDSAGVSLQRLRFICQKFHDTGSRKHSEAPPTDCRQVNAGHAAAEMLLTDMDPCSTFLRILTRLTVGVAKCCYRTSMQAKQFFVNSTNAQKINLRHCGCLQRFPAGLELR